MTNLIVFQDKKVRRIWDKNDHKWYFSIVDVLAVLTDSIDPGAYWRKLKERLKAEGNETVTNCHTLKMEAADGKLRLTDIADTEQLFRLIQSVPSPKAEPFKRWLAKVGYERLEEIENPEIASKRMREIYKQKGYSDEWIEKRVRGIAVRDELTEEWKKRGVKGFSSQNLGYMRQFYISYKNDQKLQPRVGEISWSKNVIIFSKCKDAGRMALL